MTAKNVDSIIQRCRWWMVGGAILCFVGFPTDSLGGITGFMAVWLGACGGVFGAWRYDKGLWMLSALFLTMAFFCYVGLTYGHLNDLIHHRGRIGGTMDLSFATLLLSVQSRFLLTVTIWNWKLTHR